VKGFVYIITNNNNSVLYTGVTSDLKRRVLKHKSKTYKKSFSARYNVHKLVYYEHLDTIGEAILREKQIKAGSRKKKIEMINSMNPKWEDLSVSLDVTLGLQRLPISSGSSQ
jgi:putative endonuclease